MNSEINTKSNKTNAHRSKLKNGCITGNVQQYVELDQIPDVMSLVFNPLENSGNHVQMEEKILNPEVLFVKRERLESCENSVEEEMVLEGEEDEAALQAGCHMFPLNLEEEEEEDEDTQHSLNEVTDEGVEDYISENGDYQFRLFKNNDPASQLHFVKYIKRDNKTVKMWECGMCGKEFKHQYTLMRHVPTHTDERNFKCDVCGKAFRQMSTLSQHRAIHSDARPYVCEICKKTFNRVSTLISHRKIHLNYKRHTCHICGKGFHQKGNLRNHIFTHTNERPYKCEICGKGFNQMSNLMCHKSHSHGNKNKFFCSVCNIEFPRKYALRSHEEYKHGIKYRGGVRVQDYDASKPDRSPTILKKADEKNLRIIHFPNGNRAVADTQIPGKSLTFKRSLLKTQNDLLQQNDSLGKLPAEGVMIDAINTRAMLAAKRDGQTPFALLKPVRGIPVLVKVVSAPDDKQMLVPASAEDLKLAGKITVKPGNNAGSNLKAVQIKVPVVATVIQRMGPDGVLTIEIEPPSPEELQSVQGVENSLIQDEAPVETSTIIFKDEPPSPSPEDNSSILEHPSGITEFDINPQEEGSQSRKSLLASNHCEGEIHIVFSGENGFLEVENEEEIHVVQDDGQVIMELIDNEDQIEEATLPEDYNNDSSSNKNSLLALLEAIKDAGCQVKEDNENQITITPGSDSEGLPIYRIFCEDSDEVILGEDVSSEDVVIEACNPPLQIVLQETAGVISEAMQVVSSSQ